MVNLLSNKYISGFVSVLIALYAVFIAPALPNRVLQFFDTPIGRLFFIFLAAYLASEGNTQVALMVSIALTITLMALEKKTLEESFLQGSRQVENFDMIGPEEEEPVGIESAESEHMGAPIEEEMEEGEIEDENGYDPGIEDPGGKEEETEPFATGSKLFGSGIEHFAPFIQ